MRSATAVDSTMDSEVREITKSMATLMSGLFDLLMKPEMFKHVTELCLAVFFSIIAVNIEVYEPNVDDDELNYHEDESNNIYPCICKYLLISM